MSALTRRSLLARATGFAKAITGGAVVARYAPQIASDIEESGDEAGYVSSSVRTTLTSTATLDTTTRSPLLIRGIAELWEEYGAAVDPPPVVIVPRVATPLLDRTERLPGVGKVIPWAKL